MAEQESGLAGVIYNPPRSHVCDLSGHGRWIPNTLRRGAVEVCAECGRVWVFDPVPWERRYRKMRPWPFDRKQRAALRQARRNTPGPNDEEADDV